MNRELPNLHAATYGSTTMNAAEWAVGKIEDLSSSRRLQMPPTNGFLQEIQQYQQSQQIQKTTGQENKPMSSARIVKIFIADPNENIALDKRILYRGDEKLTDLSDQELFYEIPIAEMLAKHNAERIKTVDKAQAAKFGRDICLEPAKIRDLKMVVTTVATF